MKKYRYVQSVIVLTFCFVLVVANILSCGNPHKEQPKQIYIGVACYNQKDTFLGELVIMLQLKTL